ncbi:MAG TPA: sigma-70 family RNA polymerase sigma factor [Gemmataceae bacterium]|nr:sigma-70 family RNA polymerase sigma factor [Gemmataceae bacterium]
MTTPHAAAGPPAVAVTAVPDADRMTDGRLLECFLRVRDEEAFAALVRRHGPMVLGVCRRVLAHAHDAEDAFQATFLVLARRAGSVVPRERVGNWLYGVAYRTALKAKSAAARRRARERQVADMPEPAAPEGDVWPDLRSLLDRELERLPEKYRTPVVLCDLEGSTHKEAARQLGCPEGTVSTRLTRAREMLARRLARHGLALSGVGLALALAGWLATAAVPGPVGEAVARAALTFAAGRAAAGTVPAGAAALAEGVMKAMLFAKLRVALTALLVVGALGLGAGGIAYRSVAAEKAEKAKADAAKEDLKQLQGTWVLVSMETGGKKAPEGQVPDLTFVVKDDKGTLKHGDADAQEGPLKLDAAKDPKEIDMTVGKEPIKAIYKLEKDTLTVCTAHSADERPGAFETKEGTKLAVLVFKRKGK